MDSVQTANEDVQSGLNWVQQTWNDITGLFTGASGPVELIIALVVVVIVIVGGIAVVANFFG